MFVFSEATDLRSVCEGPGLALQPRLSAERASALSRRAALEGAQAAVWLAAASRILLVKAGSGWGQLEGWGLPSLVLNRS